jgi:hypothetical protein
MCQQFAQYHVVSEFGNFGDGLDGCGGSAWCACILREGCEGAPGCKWPLEGETLENRKARREGAGTGGFVGRDHWTEN